MNEKNFQIDKKEILSKFKDLANKHAEREDDYNPAHSRTTDHPSGYFILDRVRALYHWIIEETKIDLRRKYIVNDNNTIVNCVLCPLAPLPLSTVLLSNSPPSRETVITCSRR